jgi:hypothetical protein
MKTIQVDSEVYSLIQHLAIPFEEQTPNDTLKRVLSGARAQFSTKSAVQDELDSLPELDSRIEYRDRNLNADLRVLVRENILRSGQVLYLVNSSNEKVPGYQAQVSDTENKLNMDGIPYSMSALAQQGFQVNYSVRGPAYWCTEDGISVQQLWEGRLKRMGTMK